MLNFLAAFHHDFGKGSRFLEVYLELLVTAMGADSLFFHVLFREQVTGLVILSPHHLFNFVRAQQDTPA